MRSNQIGFVYAAAVFALAMIAPTGLRHQSPVLYAAMENCLEAACRVSAADGGVGSGCVFQIADRYVYVLTAAHVVGTGGTVQCEFWKSGHQSARITGWVIARATQPQYDVAIVALPEAAFGGVLPQVVPLAPPGQAMQANQVVWSAGCAHGAWATGWQGRLLRSAGGELYFVPPPANGRSGSALFDGQGRSIVGVVKARTGDGTAGLATSVDAIYQAFARPDVQRSSLSDPLGRSPAQTSVPCPGSCPAPIPYLLPYRYREQFRNQPQTPQPSPAWPTAPGQPVAPLDIEPIRQRLDRLLEGQQRMANALEQMNATGKAPQALKGQADPSADSGGGPPGGRSPQPGAGPHSQAGQALPSAQQPGRLAQLLGELLGEPEKLPERFQARRDKVKSQLSEQAGDLEVAQAYLRDFAREKLAQGTLGLTAGQLLGAALGLSGPLSLALGGGLWLLSRRIGARLGQPPEKN